MSSNQTFYRVKADLANPSYDKRCKYGLQAHHQVPEGTLWILRRPSRDSLAKRVLGMQLTPEEAEQAVNNLSEQYASYVTPWGTADRKLADRLLESSVESFPQTPSELMFVRDMLWLTAVDVFEHLIRQHGWTISEVEQVLSELQLNSEEKDGQNA